MTQVIIIGAARSGTKFLRDLLGAARGTAVVPYDVGFVWRHGHEHLGHDELDDVEPTPRQRAWIRSRVRGMAGGSRSTPTTHRIEKSVPNSLRPRYVARILPEAHLVHLTRDGRQVVESSLRSWQAPTDLRYALRKLARVPPRVLPAVVAEALGVGPAWARAAHHTWGPRYAGIDDDLARRRPVEVCALQWARCIERSRAGLANLDQPVHHVDYDRLVSEPDAIRSLARGLQFSNDQVAQVAARWHATASTSNLHKWADGLTAAQRELIAPIVDPVNTVLGHGPVQ